MDLFLAAAGIVLALLAIIAAYDIYLRQNKTKGLGYRVVTDSPLVSPDAGRLDRLSVAYGSRRLEDPRLIVLRLANPGGVEIRPEDFQGSLRVAFDGGTRITSVVGVTTQPEALLGPDIAQEESALLVSPVLLNPGNSIDLQVLTEGPFTKVRVLGHVAGVNEIIRLPEHEGTSRGRLVASRAAVALTVLAVATLVSVVWFIKVLLFPEQPPLPKKVAAQQFSLEIGDTIAPDSPNQGAGFLEESGSVDVYRFTGKRDQRIFLQRRDCDNNFTIEMQVLRPDNQRLPNFPAFDSSCRSDSRPFLLPEDGTYSLRVNSSYSEAPGTYRFTLWDSPSERYRTDMHSVITDTIDAPRTQHIYTFDAKKGDVLRFDGETVGGLDIDWALRSPDDSDITNGSALTNTVSLYPITLNVDGTYSLIIDGKSTGSYTIRPKLSES